jgi:CheY-like chemotaxis protein
VLLQGADGTVQPEVVGPLEQHFTVSLAKDVAHVCCLLEQHGCSTVAMGSSQFLALAKNPVHQQAIDILNTIGEGVCIVGQEGTILWANRKMESFAESVSQAISQHSRSAFEYFRQNSAEGPSSNSSSGIFEPLRPRKYSFTDDQARRYFEMVITPMTGSDGSIRQMTVVIRDATAARRLQQRIDAIDKAGSELVRLDVDSSSERIQEFSNLTVEQRVNLLQDKIVRHAKNLLRFDHFVVRLLNSQNNQLEVLFSTGLPPQAYIDIFANCENNGVTGYVAATGRSYICNSPGTDPHYLPGLDNACCSLTVPLRLHDRVIGTLNVESDKKNAFNEEDRQIAEIFGRYIAIAINILDLMVVQCHQATGQTTETLNSQISGPLCNIITEMSVLLEDYIGHDDIRPRLQAAIDNAAKIKKTLKDLRSGPKGIFDVQNDCGCPPDPRLWEKRILVVDDEEFIRQTICDVVGRQGCIIDMARDGREAVALINQHQYDLVISDIKMPHASGYEVFAAARAANKKIPVILMTGFGYDPNHSIVRANREGLNAVLYKPFKVDQLLHEIRQAIVSVVSE